ncbi:MAG: GntG family PLP-dependent aldolase [Acidimicrobiales bacterium]
MRDSGFVDLRSDTVTQPTAAMRRAMAEAEVGDDGYGEDPTVNRLEERVASLLGKSDALFVPSGTMANQIALCLLSRPGTNVVVGWRAHLVNHEMGAAARNALIQFVTVDDADGRLALDDIQWAIEAGQHHHVEVSAIGVENTHMVSGGTPVSLELLRSIASLRLPVHMDGARLFNASVASGIAPAIYAATATTVMVSLSKGLAAPVGSLLVMPAGLADLARVERKRLGGAMRQAGILAAAGLVALDTMVERLAEDHERAARLRAVVQERWPGSIGDPGGGGTNIVCFEHSDPSLLLHHLQQNGVLAGTVAPGIVRLVTHCDVDGPGIERAIAALRSSAN